jgi:hypothetical protein
MNGGGGEKEGTGSSGGEKTQTMYAHMNKRIKNKKDRILEIFSFVTLFLSPMLFSSFLVFNIC